MMPDTASQPDFASPPDPQVPMTDVVGFVRQLSHDLRNHLNAAELQSTYISEIADDAELKDEVKRLRSMLAEMGGSLQNLTQALMPVTLTEMPYEAADFIEDLRSKLAQQMPEQSGAIDWKVAPSDALLQIDPQILQLALLELIKNAFLHERAEGQLQVGTEVRAGSFIFTLREPKSTFSGKTDRWGHEPFRKVKHGHYGLGLPRVRSIIEAHGGELHAHYDPEASSLLTTISLPVGSRE